MQALHDPSGPAAGDETIVLPGHNGLTTIGAERRRTFALWGRKGVRARPRPPAAPPRAARVPHAARGASPQLPAANRPST